MRGNALAMVGFMMLLAGLDLTGTLLAKEWSDHRATWQLLAGGAAFLALFAALVCGLRYAEMSILTLGWIVVLQLGVMLVDRSRYGTTVTWSGWMAIGAILVLQGYLIVGAGTRSN